MSSSDGESIFLTQSKFKDDNENHPNTDGVLSDILDMEAGPDFDLIQNCVFSDISDEDMINASQEVESIDRFLKPLNQQDLDDFIRSGLSKKTESKSKWALNLFASWQQERKKKQPYTDVYMYKNIMNMQDDEIDKCLNYFVAEVRNKSGLDYKPNTLYEIICAIQHFMRKEGRFVSILDDKKFQGLRTVLDSKMKELSSRGLGLDKKKAEIITAEQEDIMWRKGILGSDSPAKLLDTVLFQLGLHFALRAGQEHRNLRFGPNSQITVCFEQYGTKYLEYKEDVSKTNRGGLQHKHLAPKITRAYQNTNVPERCPVLTYEKYISLRPADGKCDAFYLRPLKYITATSWYADAPVGVHILQKTVGKLCEQAGFSGHFTHHSLRATAVTRLYDAGVDEQLIAEKTGHRSSAVRSYKRTQDAQLVKVSEIIHGKEKPLKEEDENKENVKKLRTEEDSKRECGPREIHIEQGNISFKFKF